MSWLMALVNAVPSPLPTLSLSNLSTIQVEKLSVHTISHQVSKQAPPEVWSLFGSRSWSITATACMLVRNSRFKKCS